MALRGASEGLQLTCPLESMLLPCAALQDASLLDARLTEKIFTIRLLSPESVHTRISCPLLLTSEILRAPVRLKPFSRKLRGEVEDRRLETDMA